MANGVQITSEIGQLPLELLVGERGGRVKLAADGRSVVRGAPCWPARLLCSAALFGDAGLRQAQVQALAKPRSGGGAAAGRWLATEG